MGFARRPARIINQMKSQIRSPPITTTAAKMPTRTRMMKESEFTMRALSTLPHSDRQEQVGVDLLIRRLYGQHMV